MIYFIFMACNSISEEKKEDDAMQAELKLLYQIEKEPSQAHLYCEKFHLQKHQNYCNNIIKRPHLWQKIEPYPFTERKGGGPNAIQIHIKDISSDELSMVLPSDSTCKKNTTYFQCRIEKMMMNMEPISIASECNTLEHKERSECYFLAAESHFQVKKNIPLAFDLCNESGHLWNSCLQHIVHIIAQDTPLADAKQEEWDPILLTYRDIQEYWNRKHKPYTPIIIDYFWERVCSFSISKLQLPVGDLLDYLPQSSFPHIHSHIAYQTIKSYRQNHFSLLQWTEIVNNRINSRSYNKTKNQIQIPKPLPSKIKKKRLPPHFRKWDGITKNWPHDSRVDEHFPATYYLKDSRRVTSKKRTIDVQISILEALHRLNYDEAILHEGLHSTSTYVQFTAYRLMRK